jgi:hypothetical protein
MTKMMVPTNPIIVLAMVSLAVLLTLDWFIGGLAYTRSRMPLAVAKSPNLETDPIRQAA